MSQNIPTRSVQLGHVSELPHDYSSTPGGTIFSTTPGAALHGESRCRDSGTAEEDSWSVNRGAGTAE
ncbi:Eukaryotic translation initiation factor 4E-binding protein 2 [Amphibalanus amphitrite]|uniref:Eukaryotic translation initiation factor 4E-binding protein 2 n=1 Tax=Amphibalanus amphitrite TaxID=1232801 RepID=A0A6A4W0B7_AMPAM|nr:Eukaryotic translation initiation factor 4E-binding protein 2 [Amphibalanus amphitrite]